MVSAVILGCHQHIYLPSIRKKWKWDYSTIVDEGFTLPKIPVEGARHFTLEKEELTKI